MQEEEQSEAAPTQCETLAPESEEKVVKHNARQIKSMPIQEHMVEIVRQMITELADKTIWKIEKPELVEGWDLVSKFLRTMKSELLRVEPLDGPAIPTPEQSPNLALQKHSSPDCPVKRALESCTSSPTKQRRIETSPGSSPQKHTAEDRPVCRTVSSHAYKPKEEECATEAKRNFVDLCNDEI